MINNLLAKMPVYEGIGSDKNSVVFEFGSAYTKCGFTSELAPRAIIPSQLQLQNIEQMQKLHEIKNTELLELFLKKFLQTLYFKYLAVNPKDRRVVVVESIFLQNFFRNTLAKVFFKFFEVPSLLIVPSHVVLLATLGINTGLVLDIGYIEAIAIPIYEGVTALDAIKYAPLGGKSIHYRIMDELIQRKTVIKEDDKEKAIVEKFTENILEDIKLKTCFVTTFEQGSILAQQKLDDKESLKLEVSLNKPLSVHYAFNGNKILKIPGSLRESVCEVLFEMYGEEHTLPTLVIDSILSCPIDCRRKLASNVIVIGGTAMIPGLKHRLFKEIKYLTTNSIRYKNIFFANDFKFHHLPCKENYAAWLGASIFSTSDLLTMRSITNEQYKKNNETIPDWTSWNLT